MYFIATCTVSHVCGPFHKQSEWKHVSSWNYYSAGRSKKCNIVNITGLSVFRVTEENKQINNKVSGKIRLKCETYLFVLLDDSLVKGRFCYSTFLIFSS